MKSDAVSPRKRDNESGRQLSPEQAAAAAMVAEARARGLELTGPDGLLKLFTKNVLETALTNRPPRAPETPGDPPPGTVISRSRRGSRTRWSRSA
jgi:putative transposase